MAHRPVVGQGEKRAKALRSEVAVVGEPVHSAPEFARERLAVLHHRRAAGSPAYVADDDRGRERTVLYETDTRGVGRRSGLLHQPHIVVHAVRDAPAILVRAVEPVVPCKAFK